MAARKRSALQAYLSQQYIDFDLDHPTQRLNSLYADFSKLLVLNPYGYNANVSYWRSVILDCNAHGVLGNADYRLAFDMNELGSHFLRPGLGKPLALSCVVNSMVENKELVTLGEFMAMYQLPNETSSSTWWWSSISQWLWSRSNGNSTSSETYIVMPTLKSIAKHIVQSYANQTITHATTSLMTLPDFRAHYGQLDNIDLTDSDIWLLLRYLNAEMGVAVADNVKGYGTQYVVVKFPAKDEKAEITQHDRALVSMKTTCHALKVQVDELQSKAEELATMAHEHYRAKRKAQALYAHKRKKHIMEILDRRLRSLETMEMMLLKIETSQNDLQVVRAFNMGADALQSILSKEDLSLATVDEAMFKVQKAFEDQKEVEDAIVMGTEEANNRVPELDDDELEKELEDLQREEMAAQQQQQQLLSSSPSRPPLRQVTQSAPPPDRSESELARINNLFQQLRKTDTPPSTTPRLQQPSQPQQHEYKMLAE